MGSALSGFMGTLAGCAGACEALQWGCERAVLEHLVLGGCSVSGPLLWCPEGGMVGVHVMALWSVCHTSHMLTNIKTPLLYLQIHTNKFKDASTVNLFIIVHVSMCARICVYVYIV